MMKPLPVILFLLLTTVWQVRSEVNVFDKPTVSDDHRRMLSLMNEAHRRADYDSMAIFSLAGIRLGSDDALWYYNHACARSLQKRIDDALDAMNHAIDAGYTDAGFAEQDSDLAALRADPRYVACLRRMEELREKTPIKPLIPDAGNRVVCADTAVTWNYANNLFEAAVQPAAVTNRPSGPFAPLLAEWTREGTADDTFPILYVNRDGDVSHPDLARYPSVIALDYPEEMVQRERHLGLPNMLFIHAKTGTRFPVIGNSAFRSIGNLADLSLPLYIGMEPRPLLEQSLLISSNQLYFYPVGIDFSMKGGDRFVAHQPITINVAGAVKSELPFVETAFAAILAMKPQTRDVLIRNGLLGTTLNMLFRASQKTVRKREDYLTRLAHPVAFLPGNLDSERLIRMAHDLPEDLPGPPPLEMVEETATRGQVDFFELPGTTENICTTPFSITRIFRGRQRTRRYRLKIAIREPVRIHWTLLQGDPAKVRISPTEEGAVIEVDYHAAFPVPALKDELQLTTCRVDVAAIAEANGYYSMPSIFSVYFLPNETRVYDDAGRIRSIDYTRHQPAYANPLISLRKNWRDDYTYAPDGTPLGWQRFHPLEWSAFTPEGDKILSRDAQGRPLRIRPVKYLLREVRRNDAPENGEDARSPSAPTARDIDLAEVDDGEIRAVNTP